MVFLEDPPPRIILARLRQGVSILICRARDVNKNPFVPINSLWTRIMALFLAEMSKSTGLAFLHEVKRANQPE